MQNADKSDIMQNRVETSSELTNICFVEKKIVITNENIEYLERRKNPSLYVVCARM